MQFRNLLIVEDDENDSFILKIAMKRATLPYHIYFAQDGREGIEWLCGEGKYGDRSKYPIPDFLITDLKMPRCGGFELLKWARSNPQFADLPIFILSSSDEPSDVEQAYKLNSTMYFVKTPDFQDVILFLRTLATSFK